MNPFYSEVIIDHNLHPLNKDKKITDAKCFDVTNASCGDKYRISIKTQKGKIVDASFSGTGCAISQASADMMSGFLIGKKVSDVDGFFDDFRKVIQTGEACDGLGELNEFRIISKMPMRAKCAELPWTFCADKDLITKIKV